MQLNVPLSLACISMPNASSVPWWRALPAWVAGAVLDADELVNTRNPHAALAQAARLTVSVR